MRGHHRGVHRSMVSEVLDAVAALRDKERLGAMITVLEGPDAAGTAVVDRLSGITAGDGQSWMTADIRSDALR